MFIQDDDVMELKVYYRKNKNRYMAYTEKDYKDITEEEKAKCSVLSLKAKNLNWGLYNQLQDDAMVDNGNGERQFNFRAYCKSGKRPENIPTDPSRTYEKEYRGAKDWIGNAFWSLNKIKKFIRPLNIKGSTGWRNYCTSGKKPKEIPSSIGRVYKDEWPGFKIFLRKNSEKMYNSE